MNRVLGIALLIVTMGCATGWRKSTASGFMGCDEEEVQVSNEKSSIGSSSWVAECRGKKFYCMSTSGGLPGANNVHCSQSQ